MITLELGHILTLMSGAIAAYALLGKLLVMQFTKQVEAKFRELDDRLGENKGEWERLDRELNSIRLLLAQEYVRITSLEKLDLKMDRTFQMVFEKLDSKPSKDEVRQYMSKP